MPIYNAPLPIIDQQETKRYAGLGNAKFDEQQIQAACQEARILSQPQSSWEIYDYQAYCGTIAATPPTTIVGQKINQHLAAAEKIIFIAVTLGETIENTITEYFQAGRYSYSLLLDAAATAAIETAADQLEKTIQQHIKPQGYQMLYRFSPGYGDWDIHFQPQMLKLANAASIGVQLTENYMLLPRKSITAVIGLIPHHQQQRNTKLANCSNCNKLDCLARREFHL